MTPGALLAMLGSGKTEPSLTCKVAEPIVTSSTRDVVDVFEILL